jgi:hypothetical protein
MPDQDFPLTAIVLSLVLGAGAACLSSCAGSAELVTTRGDLPDASPNGKRGGIVNYADDGSAWARKRRRADAFKKMAAYCAGDYRVINEGQALGATMMIPAEGMPVASSANRWVLNFECSER